MGHSILAAFVLGLWIYFDEKNCAYHCQRLALGLKKIYLLALATIVIARFLVWGLPKVGVSDPFYVNGFRWHHFHTGLVLLALGLFLPKRFVPRVLVLGIGAGLTIDEITLPLFQAGFEQFTYWSAYAIVPIVIV